MVFRYLLYFVKILQIVVTDVVAVVIAVVVIAESGVVWGLGVGMVVMKLCGWWRW